MTTIPVMRYRLQEPSPLVDYVLRFIFNSLGIAASPTTGDNYQLYYGAQPPTNPAAVVIQANPAAVVWQELLDGKVDVDALGWVIPFDVVNGIAGFLTDRINANIPESAYDSHHHLRAAQTFQGQAHITAIPIVNLYVNLLRDVFERRLNVVGIPLLPPGKRYAIGLSHDVDRLQRRGIIKALLYLRYAGIGRTFTQPRYLWGFFGALLRSSSNDFVRFRELVQTEESHGFRSTYFFSPLPFFTRQRAILDILYDIDHPNFRSLFQELKARGFEIGIHASYKAFQSAENFSQQKQRLEAFSQTRMKGLRHHYWHVGPDLMRTLWYHAQAGFQYDSSVSFDDDLAFRRGTALPYYPWDIQQQRSVPVMQLPVFCMDGHLFYNPDMSVDVAVQQACEVMQTIKQQGGVGVIDWHSDTSNPNTPLFEKWGECYYRLLTVLAADSEAWVTSLETLHQWFFEREKQLAAAANAAV